MFVQQLVERQFACKRQARYRAHAQVDRCPSRRCRFASAPPAAAAGMRPAAAAAAAAGATAGAAGSVGAHFDDAAVGRRLRRLGLSRRLEVLLTLSPVSCMALAPMHERYLLVGGWRRTLELVDLDPAPKSFALPPEVAACDSGGGAGGGSGGGGGGGSGGAGGGGPRKRDRCQFVSPHLSSSAAAAATRQRRVDLVHTLFGQWQAARRSTVPVRPRRLWFSDGKAVVGSSQRRRRRQRVAEGGGGGGGAASESTAGGGGGAEPAAVEAARGVAHGSALSAVRWVPDDTALFASASMDGTLKLWDTTALQLLAQLEMPDEAHIQDIDFGTAAHQHLVAVASSSKDLLLYDPRCNELVASLQGCTGALHAVRWRPTHPFDVAAGCEHGTCCIFDIRRSLSGVQAGGGGGGSGRGGGGGGKGKPMPLRYLDMQRAKATDLDATVPPKAHLGAVHGLTFTGDGDMLLSTGTDGRLRLWAVHASPRPTNTLAHYFPLAGVGPSGGSSGGPALAEPGACAPSSLSAGGPPMPAAAAAGANPVRRRCVVFHPGLVPGSFAAFELLSGRHIAAAAPVRGGGPDPGGYMGPLRTLVYRRTHQQLLGAGRFPVVMAWDCSGGSGVDASVTDENRSAHAPARRRGGGGGDGDAWGESARIEDDEDEDWSD